MDNCILMSERKSRRNFSEGANCFARRKDPATEKSRAQRFPLHERHYIVREDTVASCCKQRNNVRVMESSQELNLALEPLDFYSCRNLRREHLHDDFSAERCLGRNEHPRHSPTAELALDRIRRS